MKKIRAFFFIMVIFSILLNSCYELVVYAIAKPGLVAGNKPGADMVAFSAETYTCPHTKTYTEIIKAPTCTESGKSVWKCTECRTEVGSTNTPPTGHSYNDSGVCSNCGSVKPLDRVSSIASDNEMAQLFRQVGQQSAEDSKEGKDNVSVSYSTYQYLEGHVNDKALKENEPYGASDGNAHFALPDGVSDNSLDGIQAHTITLKDGCRASTEEINQANQLMGKLVGQGASQEEIDKAMKNINPNLGYPGPVDVKIENGDLVAMGVGTGQSVFLSTMSDGTSFTTTLNPPATHNDDVQTSDPPKTTPTPRTTTTITPTPSISTSITPTPSAPITPTPSTSITPTPSTSTSITPTPSTSITPTPSTSTSITPTPSTSITPTPSTSTSITPTPTPSTSITPTPSTSTSITPTPTPSTSTSITPTPTPSTSTSITPTPTPSTSITPTPTITPTITPTPTPTVTPTITPSPTPKPTPTPVIVKVTTYVPVSSTRPSSSKVTGSVDGSITISKEPIQFKDIVPEINSLIVDEDPTIYDVTDCIPTKEMLHFKSSAQNAIYDIILSNDTVYGEASGTVAVNAYYEYTQREVVGTTIVDVYLEKYSGDKLIREFLYSDEEPVYGDVTHSGYKGATQDIETSINPSLIDVVKSDVFELNKDYIYAQHANGDIIKPDYNAPNVGLDYEFDGSPINLSVKEFNGSGTNMTYSAGTSFTSEASAQEACNNSIDGYALQSINALRQLLFDSIDHEGDYVKLHFYDLDLETYFSSFSSEYKAPEGNEHGPIDVDSTFSDRTGIIPATYANGQYKGKAEFKYADGSTFTSNEVPGEECKPVPNDVWVFAPVHNTTTLSNDEFSIDQRINKGQVGVQLDSIFTVNVSTTGEQIDSQGYDNYMDTSPWVGDISLKMPFDVYYHEGAQKRFIPKGGTVSNTTGTFTFTVPVWVKEDNYTIESTVSAINSEHGTMSEYLYNNDFNEYYATNSVSLEVYGKIYDLQVNNSFDPDWTNKVYSQKYGNDYILEHELPFGQIGQNKNSAYKYAPKLGYTFTFNFKTKGRKSNNVDVSIQPEGFYFVSKSGGQAKEVDLYYNTPKVPYVKIDPYENQNDRKLYTRLSEPILRVQTSELTDSSRIYSSRFEKEKYMTDGPYNYNISVEIGNLCNLQLPHSLRLCYNNFEEYVVSGRDLYGGHTEVEIANDSVINDSVTGSVGKDNVIGSVGRWYAGYLLPVSTVAVPKGADVKDSKNILHNGYILVKMSFITKDKEGNPYLKYTGPEAYNEETGKPYTNNELHSMDPALLVNIMGNVRTKDKVTINLPSGAKAEVPNGTIAIYETDYRASQDYTLGQSH